MPICLYILSYSNLFANMEYAIREVVKVEKPVKYWKLLETHRGIINYLVNLIIDDIQKAIHKTLGAMKYKFKLSIKIRPIIPIVGVTAPMNIGDINTCEITSYWL